MVREEVLVEGTVRAGQVHHAVVPAADKVKFLQPGRGESGEVRALAAENVEDRIGQLATAKMQGFEEGREEERLKTAKAMKAEGISTDVIAKCTGLTPEQIESL